MASTAMKYIMEMIAVIIAISAVVPIAMTLLFNGTAAWGNTPSYIITLLTTVVAIFFALGIMLKMMPADVKSRVGLWVTIYPTVKATAKIPRYTQKKIYALNHFRS